MAVREVEKDVELALMEGIKERLAADGVTGVEVDALLHGAPYDEPNYPYVFVMCQPLTHKGGTLNSWSGQASIEIKTKHITTEDRDASNMAQILGSVAYALDFDSFSTHTQRVNAVHVRRNGGNYVFDGSTNEVQISVEIVEACGQKS